jgi:hypothetical protein
MTMGTTIDGRPTAEQVRRLLDALQLETPLVAIYDADPSAAFEPIVRAKGRACCFAYYPRWLKGETLAIERSDDDFETPSHGCPGMQRAFGLNAKTPTWMANFLTDGAQGAPMGEGLKASPALAQAYLDRVRPLEPAHGHLLMGPLRLEQWPAVRSVTFLADPDRLSALLTLATYWSSDPDEVAAPFSSGCGLMWRELEASGRDRAVLGCTDIAMRKYLPAELLGLSVTPTRFARMVDFPDGAFLNRSWWKELLASRRRRAGG